MKWTLRVVALGALTLGCGRTPEPTSSVVWSDCSLGRGTAARCTTVDVAENRSAPANRTLSLSLAVVPAREPIGRPPVLLIAGGPGQGSQAAYGATLSAFEAVSEHHDLVLLDQRGTGRSHALVCERTQVLDLQDAVSMRVDTERIEQCRDAQDADLTQYTTAHAIEDLAEVLDALGYPRAHLVGASYGTRVALAFARAYPERTASIVIDGVAAPDFALPLSFARDAEAAMDAMVADCEAEDACAAAFPNLAADLRALASRPVSEVTVAHPRTGAPETLELGGRAVAAGIRGMLYAPELAALLPLSITSATSGEFGPLVAQAALLGDGIDDSLAEGMFLSVVCAEDVPFITDADAAAATRGTTLGTMFVEHLRTSCGAWVQGAVAPEFREPVVSDVPALVLSGALDPVTPPRWGAHALEGLANGRHIVVPGAGHGIATLPCADGVLAEFFEGLDASKVDATCLESRVRPPFFIDFAGPQVNP